MRKLIVWMNPSLDGFIAREDGSLDWQTVDEEIHRHMNEKAEALGGFLHGRVMYDLMAAFWPTADADESNPDFIREFSRIWKSKPKVMFSRTIKEADWNTRVVNDNIEEEVARLKREPGGDLAVGGAKIAAELQSLGLIDEYHLFVHPVAIGHGQPLFPASNGDVRLRLVETRTFTSGVVLLRYETVRNA